MDITNTLSAVRLLYDCLIKGKPNFALLTPHPSKTELLSPKKEPYYKAARPARVGADGEKLLAFARTISGSREGNVHAITVLSHGKCIFEAAKAGYSLDMPHAAFSLSKTVTALAVGMLVDDGKLSTDDLVLSYFPEIKEKRLNAKFKKLTVAHLLSMAVELPYNEVGVVISESYTNSFFESAPRSAPGTTFAYNSMCSYILAVIVTRVSGTSLSAFLDERLFSPMDIRNYFWEKSKEGVEKGGWGLYLSVRSMAKLGMLFLNEGIWNGKRLISDTWISRMKEKHNTVPDAIGVFDYGYHLWCHKEDDSFLLNGMLGQNVWISPKSELVVAITAGDSCLFQDSQALLAAMRYLKNMTPHDTHAAKKERRRIARHFGEESSLIPPYISPESREAQKKLFPALSGRFALPENNTGVLPLITRLIQNSPTKGISSLSIGGDPRKDVLLFTFTEGDATYRISAGNARFLDTALAVHGEQYRVAAAYACGLDENREPYLRLEIRFPALADTRRLLFRREGHGFSLLLTEQPGYEFVKHLLKNAAEKPEFFETLARTASPVDFLLKRVKNVFAPSFHLSSSKSAKRREKV